MKKIFLLLPVLFLSFFSGAQDLTNYIPENSNYIVKINGKRINNNVNFDEIRASDMYKDFIFKTLNNKTTEDRAIFKLFETPDETGLNLKSDIYAYTLPEEQAIEEDYYYRSRATVVFAMPLLNQARFTSFIKDIFHDNSRIKIAKASKGVYFVKNNTTLIVWNSEKVFLCILPYKSYYDKKGYSTSEIKKIIKTIAYPMVSKSIASNPKLLAGLTSDSDITYVFNSSSLKSMSYLFGEINSSEIIKDSTLLTEELFKDNYSFSYINFENGKIVLKGDQFYGSQLANIINPIFNAKPSPNLANILYQTPVTSYMSYAFSFAEAQKFANRTFNYNMDTILIDYVRSSESSLFNADPVVHAYNVELDSIEFLLNGPEETDVVIEDLSVITDSGTVYSDDGKQNNKYDNYNNYDNYYDSDQEKYSHETLNWYEVDSLYARRDTLYTLIEDRKDTLAIQTYKKLNIKGDDMWGIFKGDFLFLYHAMTTVEKKSKVYEMDEEFNYVEVEKSNKVPMPLYSIAASINSDSLFNKYLNILIQKGLVQKEKNRYLVVIGDMNQYIWIHKSICILTNDNNFNPTKRSTASKSDYEVANYNRITTHQSGAYIEVGKILASSVQFIDDKETAEVVEILAKYFDETVYTNTFGDQPNVATKTDIVFNDEKRNSINIICNLMNEIYVHFTKK